MSLNTNGYHWGSLFLRVSVRALIFILFVFRLAFPLAVRCAIPRQISAWFEVKAEEVPWVTKSASEATTDWGNRVACHHCETTEGFAHALWLAVRLKPGGGAHFGVLCSSFVRISCGTTGRSKGCPLGRLNIESVQASNVMAGRVALLLLLLVSTGMWVTIEQPASSVLEFQPSLQRVFGMARFHSLRFAMWSFGHSTLKPTVLYSSCPWIAEVLEYSQDRGQDHTDEIGTPNTHICILSLARVVRGLSQPVLPTRFRL